MNRNNFWKWVLVYFVLGWAVYSIYPPSSRNLVEEFADNAANRDTNFTAIITKARELEKERPNRGYNNLLEAIGTNDLRHYFPQFRLAENEPRPNRAILNRLQRESAGKVRLGLDLQGGTAFVVKLQNTAPVGDTNAAPDEVDRTAMVEQAIEVLRKRVDAFGVAEPVIIPAGSDRIMVQLPGLSEADIQTARTTIEKAAYLEFRLVHAESDQLIAQGITAPGYERLTLRRQAKDGQREIIQQYLVKRKPEQGLIGKYVSRAGVTRDPLSNQPQIMLRFDSKGSELFADITRANVGRQLAIVLDGELYSAPNINEPITGGNAVISGDFTLKEALELSHILENPLEAPLEIVEQRGVDPSLGKDSIRSGIRAAIIGVVAVAAFMLVYYLASGVVANIALLMNIVILLGVMCAVGTTLTVPGIAGIVLTIGMAVDANVLIYERIREELAAGKSLRGALSAGYGKAFGTIFDSNLTTLIASVILIFMGTGPVKGFGVALTIGVLVSMFTALTVTRLIFDALLARGLIKKLNMLHLVRGSNINFLRVAKPAFALSWAIIIIGIGYGLFVRGGNVMGVDFAGGDSVTLNYTQQVPVERLRAALDEAKIGESTIQYQQSALDNTRSLQVTSRFESGEQVIQLLKQKFPEANFQPRGIDKVGPVVGAEILRTAIIAALLAMFGILVYVAMRYEFSFAVGAVVAIIHDILMTLGVFFLSGRQLSAPIVAAVLTIIGFSINDTIVIFDRIREDLKLGMKGSFAEIINRALNQTLSRTIITSGTVFLATLSLYLFGGGVINDFAFTFLAGIITGTYSSIYIATALVLWWHKGERPRMATTSVISEPSEPRSERSMRGVPARA
jgi:SecD/SecF fusion protein